MPSSRRSRGGGIRKKSKRKDPNRQRLQKAAIKSAEKERKQQLRYEAFQTRHLPPAVTKASSSPAPQSASAPISVLSEYSHGEANSTLDYKTPSTSRDTYNKLMQLLASSEKPSVPKRPRTALSSDETKNQEKVLPSAPKKSKPENAPEPPPEVSDEVADATAAARALAHFGLDSNTVQKKPKPELGTPINVEDIGQIQSTYDFPDCTKLPQDIRGLSLQPTLETMWRRTYGGVLNGLSGAMVCAMRDFHDLVLTRRLPPAGDARIRKLAVAHALAHVLRCRAQVKRHDIAASESGDGARDQGFSRARVLFLVPMRNAAHEIVRTIAELCAPVTGGDAMKSVAHRARFEKEFGPEDESEDELDFSTIDDDSHAAEVASSAYDRGARSKPMDFRYTFRGNCDDDFKLGIQLYRKQLKLYTDFYDSDIIIASPLGLQRSQAAKAAGYQGPSKKKKDDDDDGEWKSELAAEKNRKREITQDDDGFLSSIEICVIDAAHVFEMQNWSWLLETLRRVNIIPTNTRDTDFSRVRDWALDGLMPKFRQTILLSAYRSPALMALVRTFENHAGRVLIGEKSNSTPSRRRISGPVHQIFQRVPIEIKDTKEAEDARFDYFERELLNPLLSAGTSAPVLVVAPTYFDFIRIRNTLYKAQRDDPSIAFATMCEYSRPKDVARARARLAQKQVGIVVCSERFHFYWRHWLRGISSVIWYAPPANAHFYPEFLNMAIENQSYNTKSTMLFDHTDALTLSRIVGIKTCRKLLHGNELSYSFNK